MFKKNNITTGIIMALAFTASQNNHAVVGGEIVGVAMAKAQDMFNSVMMVITSQTSRAAEDISNARKETLAQKVATESAVEQAKTHAQTFKDHTIGRGFSHELGCAAIERTQNEIDKTHTSDAGKLAYTKSRNAMTYTSSAHPLHIRTHNHYTNYCHITEVANKLCLPNMANGENLQGMDTNYVNIAENRTLNEQQTSAAESFAKQIIHPFKTTESTCDNDKCAALKQIERYHETLGGMAQNAFVYQIQDATAYTTAFGGAPYIVMEQKEEELSGAWDGRLAYNTGNTTNIQGTYDELPVSDIDIEGDISPAMKAVLKAIAHGEAKSYEAYNNGTDCGTKSKPNGDGVTKITEMTPVEIIRRYNSNYTFNGRVKKISPNVPCSQRLFAVGLYQIVPETLNNLLVKYPQYKDVPFTPEVQTKFGLHLALARPAAKAYIEGRQPDINKAIQQLGFEWASIPIPKGYARAKGNGVSDGEQSAYGSGNVANKVSGDMLKQALIDARAEHQNGGHKNTSGGKAPNNTTPSATSNTGGNSANIHPDASKVGYKYHKVREAKNSELTSLPEGEKINKAALDDLNKLKEAFYKGTGLRLTVLSGFRSVEYQQGIITRKKNAKMSDKEIYSRSAPAGYSEHHSGSAMDFAISGSINLTNSGVWADNAKGYLWLKNNAHLYGFTQSYPKNNQNGISQENWHWLHKSGNSYISK